MMHLIRSDDKLSLNFESIGTAWQIEVQRSISDEVISELEHVVNSFDKRYSRFRDDSWIAQLARSSGDYELPAEDMQMFAYYELLEQLTDGAMTPLIGQTLVDAGYDANYSFRYKKKTVPPRITEVYKRQGTRIVLREPALLDVGAIGKGFLVDKVVSLLQSAGYETGVVDAGGDMRLFGENADTSIALQHPLRRDEAIGVATIQGGALCGSSTQLRSWDDYNHIVNARTGESIKDIAAVWVYAETAAIADAICTALCFMPPDVLCGHFKFSYVILNIDDAIEYSPEFPATFFNSEEA